MRLRWKLAVVPVVVAGAVVGVLRATAGSDTPAPPGTTVPGPVAYPTVGVTLDAPPPGAQPAVSSATAWATWQTIPIHSEAARVAKSVSIQFGEFTNNMYGHINADNSVTPEFQHRLSWIVTFLGVPESPSGPAPGPGMTQPPKPTLHCDFLFVVDANTGAYLTAFDVCPGPSGA